jgi:o-succinylbenzoate synthase
MRTRDKIERVESWVVEVPLKKTWRISLYSAEVRYHLVVRLVTGQGVEGYGEVSPAPAFMGEESRVITRVIETLLSPVLVGADPFDLESIHARMDQAIQGNGAAKAALDIALYDLQGKILDMPLYVLLGGMYRTSVPLSWVLGMQDMEQALEEARHFVGLGIKTIKFKIGKDPARDLALLEALRKEFGHAISIRVDANQGYRADQALKILRSMEAYDLEAIEQPVPAWDLEGMQGLAEALDTPIMADESVFSLADAYRVIKMRAADILNIKIGKVGGIYPAKKIAAVAQAANIPVAIGTNLELGIGSAASVHFGLSTANVLYPSDLLLGPDLHEFDIIEPSFSLVGGEARPFDRPGLGIELGARGEGGSRQ